MPVEDSHWQGFFTKLWLAPLSHECHRVELHRLDEMEFK